MPKLGAAMPDASVSFGKPQLGLGALNSLSNKTITIPGSEYMNASISKMLNPFKPNFNHLRVESEEESTEKLLERFASRQSSSGNSKSSEPEDNTPKKIIVEESDLILNPIGQLKPSDVIIPKLKSPIVAKEIEAENPKVLESNEGSQEDRFTENSKKQVSSRGSLGDSDNYEANKIDSKSAPGQFSNMENPKDLSFSSNNPNYIMGNSKFNKISNSEKVPSKEELMVKRIEELESKLHHEVAPVCYQNLLSPAGEWAGFNKDLLGTNIKAYIDKPNGISKRINVLVYKYLFKRSINKCWSNTVKLIIKKRENT